MAEAQVSSAPIVKAKMLKQSCSREALERKVRRPQAQGADPRRGGEDSVGDLLYAAGGRGTTQWDLRPLSSVGCHDGF